MTGAAFESYRGRKVLVAGGDGFVGFNCCRMLARLGADVTHVSRRPQAAPAVLPPRTLQVDLSDAQALSRAVVDHEVVFDCVGASGAVDSNADPQRNFDIECRPHLNLFDACSRAAKPPVVVFLSSRLVYGRPGFLPVAETHRLAPDSFYAVHKLALEHYLEVFARTRGLPYVVLRVTNPYGPGPVVPGKSYGVINQFIAQALAHQPLRIFGDGAQLRDYLFVDDLVHVMLALAARSDSRGQVFNVGAGLPISIRRAVELIVQACTSRSTIEHVPWPATALQVESGDFVADIAKLRKFMPQLQTTPFTEGIRTTVGAAQRRV